VQDDPEQRELVGSSVRAERSRQLDRDASRFVDVLDTGIADGPRQATEGLADAK
jgi:hypothetical protein